MREIMVELIVEIEIFSFLFLFSLFSRTIGDRV